MSNALAISYPAWPKSPTRFEKTSIEVSSLIELSAAFDPKQGSLVSAGSAMDWI